MKNLHSVRPNLYRGAKLSIKDVAVLNKKLGIEKIISLDEDNGLEIEPICEDLDIEHRILPLNSGDIKSLKFLLKEDITKLINPKVPTFVGCVHGRDRTGLFVALVRCLIDGWDCRDAIKEAKMFKFGLGLDPEIEKFYTKLICRACQHKHEDNNHISDIRDNMENSAFRDHTLDKLDPIAWAPYADSAIKYYPYAVINREDGGPDGDTREGYDLKDIYVDENRPVNGIPAAGTFDQVTQVTNLLGPSFISGGFV